jgi:hypothetical protein
VATSALVPAVLPFAVDGHPYVDTPEYWQRLFNRVRVIPDCCWEAVSPYALAQLEPGEGAAVATMHRVIFAKFVGPIPAGYELDHLCRNPYCVRPDHHEAVPPKVNKLRSRSAPAENARKTHCHQGHEFTPENTLVQSRGPGRGTTRVCRSCNIAWKRAWRAKRR